MNNEAAIQQLQIKLEKLQLKHLQFSAEIDQLKEEINKLKVIENTIESIPITTERTTEIPIPLTTEKETTLIEQKNLTNKKESFPIKPTITISKQPSNLEKFIGENLINKIGIAITVIGVAIGAKYSIEHELISPLTRIILGYLMALGLLGFGIQLKKKYESYSAVLVSGAIAILYFITYAAYSFYGLIPQVLAFVLMLVFTIFAVIAAIQYNKQIIAHIGLVGAYAVPFLLSDGSGSVQIMFSYMSIINIGILVLAFKKYWKPLYFVSFIVTWLIYTAWFFDQYNNEKHFSIALIFSIIFFITFYAIFLAYKLLQQEKYTKIDVVLLLSNSFVFYAVGYSILESNIVGRQLLGLFTLSIALLHFTVCITVYKKNLADKTIFYLIAGLVLIFITIAIPVQLDGNWVTLLWVLEAALLFWIGKTKNIVVYEKLSYPLMAISFISILQDWFTNYDAYNLGNQSNKITPLLNVHFLSSIIFIGAFAFINFIHFNKKYQPENDDTRKKSLSLFNITIPAILIISIYYSLNVEITSYFNQWYTDSTLKINEGNLSIRRYIQNEDIPKFQQIWVLNYSIFFLTMLVIVNIKKIQSKALGFINMLLLAFAIAIFLLQGLSTLHELKDSYLLPPSPNYFKQSTAHIWIRYVSFSFIVGAIWWLYKYSYQQFMAPLSKSIKILIDYFVLIVIISVLSSELITWMTILSFSQSYKLGLSILWGVFALLLVAVGINKNKKHLRLAAIILFSITLLKLFFYDMATLDTIAKTIVFVSLGILLLIISFLYNKFKHLIVDGNESKN